MKLISLVLICFATCTLFCDQAFPKTEKKDIKNNLFWYRGSCSSATVEFPNKTVKNISDPKIIHQITDLLNRLPVSGDIMISMVATDVLTLVLDCGKSKYRIEFYGDRIKTPKTSFFASERPEEKALFQLLDKMNDR